MEGGGGSGREDSSFCVTLYVQHMSWAVGGKGDDGVAVVVADYDALYCRSPFDGIMMYSSRCRTECCVQRSNNRCGSRTTAEQQKNTMTMSGLLSE